MEWKDLLNTEKLGEKGKNFTKYDVNVFEQDYSKIVSSSAFRRLQDKTQVYPLDDSDFARTRLTHSIEVSTIASQIGQMLVNDKKQELQERFKDLKDDIPSLLRCAGVLHDLGNPPFGHFGEATIGLWFQENLDKVKYKGKTLRTWLKALNKAGETAKYTETPHCWYMEAGPYKRMTPEERKKLEEKYPIAAGHEKLGDEAIANLEKFEGNAQALRLLCKAKYAGDIDVTYAVISSLVKYPTDSIHADKDDPDIKRHKQGVYASEADVFDTISEAMGTKRGVWEGEDDKNPGAGKYCRHPLTFIMEASDDIAYATSDLEDSYQRGMFTLQQLRKHFEKKMPEEAKKILERCSELPEEEEKGVKELCKQLPELPAEKARAILKKCGRLSEEEGVKELRKQLPELPAEEAKAILEKYREKLHDFDAAFDAWWETGRAMHAAEMRLRELFEEEAEEKVKELRKSFRRLSEEEGVKELRKQLPELPTEEAKAILEKLIVGDKEFYGQYDAPKSSGPKRQELLDKTVGEHDALKNVGEHALISVVESVKALWELWDHSFSEWLNGMRARLMNAVEYTFKYNLPEIEDGTFQYDMFQDSFQELSLAVIKSAMGKFVYDNRETSPTEISGHNSLSFLLDGFVRAALYADKAYQTDDYKPTDKDNKYWKLVSRHFWDDYKQARSGCEPFDLYLRLLTVTDHISAMTDTYAHDLAARLRGY